MTRRRKGEIKEGKSRKGKDRRDDRKEWGEGRRRSG